MQAKLAYKEAEKGTTIGAVVFDSGPLSKEMTPCDISGRDTVASNSDMLKNTSKSMKDGASKRPQRPARTPAPSASTSAQRQRQWQRQPSAASWSPVGLAQL